MLLPNTAGCFNSSVGTAQPAAMKVFKCNASNAPINPWASTAVTKLNASPVPGSLATAASSKSQSRLTRTFESLITSQS